MPGVRLVPRGDQRGGPDPALKVLPLGAAHDPVDVDDVGEPHRAEPVEQRDDATLVVRVASPGGRCALTPTPHTPLPNKRRNDQKNRRNTTQPGLDRPRPFMDDPLTARQMSAPRSTASCRASRPRI